MTTNEDVRLAREQIMNDLRQKATEQGRDCARIAALNDQLRNSGRGGIVLMTEGLAALGAAAVKAVFEAVAAFDGFTPDNDPWGEHDCAILKVAGIEVLWKVDCFDRSRQFRSPDPADPKATVRVLTVMRADEY